MQYENHLAKWIMIDGYSFQMKATMKETRLYVNIAQDCESFKAIKGNTRLYKANVILRKQKQGHSFLLEHT